MKEFGDDLRQDTALNGFNAIQEQDYEYLSKCRNSWNQRFQYINKIITTNSTGILEPQHTERLQVIDCKELFEEWVSTQNS